MVSQREGTMQRKDLKDLKGTPTYTHHFRSGS